jgi:hypothetical protein
MATADGDRLALEVGVIALLHGRVESVHVDVDDLSGGLVGFGHGVILLS